MLPKKQKFTKKIHIGYLIEYNSSNIYEIWNTSKNKIIKTKDVTFDGNSHYNSTNIDLNQFIDKPFIEINLFKLIQLNFIKAIEINSNKKLKLNPHLPKSKPYNNVESLNQTTLHVSNLNTKMFMLIFNISSNFESNTITFISFN